MVTDYCYVYSAALYCEACGEKARAELTAEGKAPEDPEDEGSYDSDDFPKGPYRTDEADCPQYCDDCGAFLENPLTDEGTRYVREAIERAIVEGKPENDSVALREWRPFYSIDPEDPQAVRLFRMTPAIRKMANEKTGELPAYAWPGGYPMFYCTGKNDACDVCCAQCANDASTGIEPFGYDAKIQAADVNYEDPDLYCECGERIESAYAEDEAEDDKPEAP